MVRKGFFIVFEGIDACGKSTMLLKTAQYLFDNFKEFDSIFITREPTFSPNGQTIRKMLKEQSSPLTSAKELLSLYLDDRKEHLSTFIRPLFSKGAVILCDRYKYSTIAYQYAQGIELQQIISAHKNMLVPDLTFILDVSPETALKRINSGREFFEKFEKDFFLKQLRENYLKLKDLLPEENIKVIDASRPVEQVFADIKVEVNELVKKVEKS